jgi:hypothetical protein
MAVYGLTGPRIREFRQHFTQTLPRELKREMSNAIAPWIQVTAGSLYGKNPFMIGIAEVPWMATVLDQMGFDLITTMCGLPDFIFARSKQVIDPNSQPVQEYLDLLAKRVDEWYRFDDLLLNTKFVPSLTVGYNPQGRIMISNHSKAEGIRDYPFYPVVRDPKPEELKTALEGVALYLSSIAHSLAEQAIPPIYFIFAANEVGLGACLYRELLEGKKIDKLPNVVRDYFKNL